MRKLLHLALALSGAWLTACGGPGLPLQPLVGSLEEESGRFTPLTFDESSLSASPYARDGTSRSKVGDAMAVATLGANSLGRGLSEFSEQSTPLRRLDNFVFVPYRMHRQATVELVDEHDGEYHFSGEIRTDAAGNQRTILRITGPDTDLRYDELYLADSAKLYVTLEGTTVEDGWPIYLRYQDVGTVDWDNELFEGRVQLEVRRRPGNWVQYAADFEYVTDFDETGEYLKGRDIWIEADGFWVASEFELLQFEDEATVGTMTLTVSDGLVITLAFLGDGQIVGQIEDTDGETLALIAGTEDGDLGLYDPETGEALVDEDGEPLIFDWEMSAADNGQSLEDNPLAAAGRARAAR